MFCAAANTKLAHSFLLSSHREILVRGAARKQRIAQYYGPLGTTAGQSLAERTLGGGRDAQGVRLALEYALRELAGLSG